VPRFPLDERVGLLRHELARHAEREANQLDQRRLAAAASTEKHGDAGRERNVEAFQEAAGDLDGEDAVVGNRRGGG